MLIYLSSKGISMNITDGNTINAINGAKRIIRKRFEDIFAEPSSLHSKYSLLYFWTNENIKEYLDLISFEGKDSALSVLASGDQAFNLVTKGIMDIDTFDTNCLTEYFALGIKKAMILKYSYNDFKKNMGKLYKFNNIGIEETYSIIRGLYPFMEHNHKTFWEALINYDYKLRKDNGSWYNLIELLLIKDSDNKSIFYNNYLTSEENYILLRSRLINANITFKCANAKNLEKDFDNDKYDLILLSNILDYFMYIFCDLWGYDHLQKYEEKLKSLCKDDAVIFLKYAFFYKTLEDVNPPTFSSRVFRDFAFKLKDLTDEEIFEISKPYTKAKDAIVLQRVMK